VTTCTLCTLGFIIGLSIGYAIDRITAPMSHDAAISAGFIDGSDAYWVARTGEPLDLTPRGR
jgi:hypothetical protein